MFMRLVQVKVKQGHLDRLREHYRQRVIATLGGVYGCRYAGLMQSGCSPHRCNPWPTGTSPTTST